MTDGRELPSTDATESGAGVSMSDRRERIAWALLFSIPPGVGIAVATAKVSFGELTDPIVVTAFGVTTVVMFAFMYGATTVNQRDDSANGSADE